MAALLSIGMFDACSDGYDDDFDVVDVITNLLKMSESFQMEQTRMVTIAVKGN